MPDYRLELPDEDTLVAGATQYLLNRHETETAISLLACQLRVLSKEMYWRKVRWIEGEAPADFGDEAPSEEVLRVGLELSTPPGVYDAMKVADDGGWPRTRTLILDALRAVLPEYTGDVELYVRVGVMPLSPNWREELLEIARGTAVNNQGIERPGVVPVAPLLWNGLRFRSESEIRIAEALDKLGVLFLPNCVARLSTNQGRSSLEADFLVCSGGKWGILEVDGPGHEGRAALDHDRDRLFRQYGVKVVERYPSLECIKNAANVVKRFLDLLQRNG